MGWRRGLVLTKHTKLCKVCGKEFETVPSSSKQHTCSMECARIRKRKNRVRRTCAVCGKDMYEIKKKSGSRKYCSTACKIKGLADLKRKNYTLRCLKGVFASSRESKKFHLSMHPYCNYCGWRDVIDILELHHKDRNRRNNTVENTVLLCPTCHTLEHYRERDGQFGNNLGRKAS